jgi:pimeloyl-ACP methyl ester carboxylesterase
MFEMPFVPDVQLAQQGLDHGSLRFRSQRSVLPTMAFAPSPGKWGPGAIRQNPNPGFLDRQSQAYGARSALGRLCAKDGRGGGAWVPLGFLASYMQHPHSEARSALLPVHLMHPELDGWTPAELSESTLRTLPRPTTSRPLRGCGHFPLETPGMQDLLAGLEEVAAAAASTTEATPGGWTSEGASVATNAGLVLGLGAWCRNLPSAG